MGRKSINSQWLIPLRKIQPSKLTLHGGGNLTNLLLIHDQ